MRIPLNDPPTPSTLFGTPDSNAKYGYHAGIDYPVGVGTPVYAPASGTVTPYTSGQYTGYVVEIFTGKYYPHVFHLSQRLVSAGQQVNEGDLIGRSGGAKGAAGAGLSTGPHLHFGVSKISVPNTSSFADYINPLSLLGEEQEMVTKEQVNALMPLLNYDGSGATQADYDYWVGKKDTNTLIMYKIITMLKGNAHTDRGLVYNILKPLLGHDPTEADYQVWGNVSVKMFLEQKVLPEIINRIKKG